MMAETQKLDKASGDHVVLEGIDPAATLGGMGGASQKAQTHQGRRYMKPAFGVNDLAKAFKKNPEEQSVHLVGESRALFALLASNNAGRATIVNILKQKSSRKGSAS
jgi:hypothetical protein